MHQVEATQAGKLDAVILWWQLNLDQAGSITLDTAPAWIKPGTSKTDSGSGLSETDNLQFTHDNDQPQQQWRDHWKQCWTPLMPGLHVGKNIKVYS